MTRIKGLAVLVAVSLVFAIVPGHAGAQTGDEAPTEVPSNSLSGTISGERPLVGCEEGSLVGTGCHATCQIKIGANCYYFT